MNRETIVPAIPDLRGDNLKAVVAALKSTLDVREGRVGDPLDQAVTLRDLVDIGALSSGGSSVLTSGSRVPVSVPGSGSGGYNPATDYTTPPAPTGLVASAGFTNVYLEWNGAPYRNHAYTEVWRAQSDSLGQAVRVGTTATNLYADPANTGTAYYYWIRFVSVADVVGPYNATSGVRVDTPVPVGYLLEQLAGQITESELYTALGERIDLIDAPASTNGSVNFRVAAEAAVRAAAITAEGAARTSAIAAEASARVAALEAEALARGAAIGAETILRGEAISAERVLREAAQAAESLARVQAIADEAAARAQAINDEAQVRALGLLQEAQTRQAAIHAEEIVRQTADSSLATQISTLTASLNTQGSTLSAAIESEALARADAVSAEAVVRETLATQLRGNYNGSDPAQVNSGLIYSERASRVTAEEALQTQITQLSSNVTTANSTLSAAITSESIARASAVSAEASERSTLATQLRGTYAGSDIEQVSSGLIYSERSSRITADEVLQTQINTLVAASSGEFGDLMAAVQEEQTARVAGDTASASSISTLSARLDNVKDNDGNVTNKSLEATLIDDRVARVDGDSALSSAISTLSATVTSNNNTVSSAIQDEATARSSADSGEVIARESLATQMRGAYDGTNPALLSSGLVYNERQARVSAEEAIAGSVSLLTATVNNNYNDVTASIFSESQARSTAVSAEAFERTTLATQIRGNYAGNDLSQVTTGLIYSERSSRIANDQVLQTSIDVLSAQSTTSFQQAFAAVETEQIARVAGDAAEASSRETLAAQLRGNYTGSEPSLLVSGLLYNERQVRISAEDALASQISLLSSTVETNNGSVNAAIATEAETRASADSASATNFTNLSATVDTKARTFYTSTQPTATAIGDLWFDTANNNRARRWDGSSWIDTTDTRITDTAASLTIEQTARADADTALASSITALSSTVTDNYSTLDSAILSEVSTRSTADETIANALTALTSTVTTNETTLSAAIVAEQTTRATQDTALATQITTLSSTVDDNVIAIQTETSTRATQTGNLFAQYTVKIDNNGLVSGFGLASTTVNATPFSEFAIRADRFYVASPSAIQDYAGYVDSYSDLLAAWASSGQDKVTWGYNHWLAAGQFEARTLPVTNVKAIPFIVQTSPTTINGTVVPPGVYMDTAYIRDATITSAKIGSLVADKITTGTLAAAIGVSTGKIYGGANPAQTFASTSFGTGFFLGDDGGTYKFYVGSPTQNMNWNGSALSVTGVINATSGVFRNITVYDGQDRVILSSTGVNTALLGLGTLATQSSVTTAQVVGLGGLATQNGVTTAQVSGLGTLATQNGVTTAQVSGLGGLATADSVFVGSTVKFGDGSVLAAGDFVNRLSQITTDNVSTFIASAAIGDAYIGNLSASKITAGTIAADRLDATVITGKVLSVDWSIITNAVITNAQIGNLAVSTIKIQDNAVTVPLVYVNYGTYTYANFFTYNYDTESYDYNNVPLLSYSFNMPSAGKAIVLWQAETDATRWCYWRVYLNGVEVGYNRAGGAFQDAPVVLAEGNVAAGSNTVTVTWLGYGGGPPDGSIVRQQLVILGAQK